MAEGITNMAYRPAPLQNGGVNLTRGLLNNGNPANYTAIRTASTGDTFNGSVGIGVSSPAIPKYYLDVMIKQDWLYAANASAVRADDDKSPRLLSPETIQRELLNPKRIFLREDGTATLLLDPNLLHSLLAQKKRIETGELKFQLPPQVKDVYYLKAPFPRIQAEQAELRLQRDFQKSAGLWGAGMELPESKLSPERPLAIRDPLKVQKEQNALLRDKSYMEIPQSGITVDRNVMLANLLDDPREKRADKPYGEYKYSDKDLDLFLNQTFSLPVGGSSGAGSFHTRDLGQISILTSEPEPNDTLDHRNIPNGSQLLGDYRSLRPFATLAVPPKLPEASGAHDGLEQGLNGSFGKVIYPVASLEKLKELLHSPLSQRIQISPRGELLSQITSGDKSEQAKVTAALMGVSAKYISIAADNDNKNAVLNFLRNNFQDSTSIGGSANEFRTIGHPSVGRTYLTVEGKDPFIKMGEDINAIREDPEKKEKKCTEISNMRNSILIRMNHTNDPGGLAALQRILRSNTFEMGLYQCN